MAVEGRPVKLSPGALLLLADWVDARTAGLDLAAREDQKPVDESPDAAFRREAVERSRSAAA